MWTNFLTFYQSFPPCTEAACTANTAKSVEIICLPIHTSRPGIAIPLHAVGVQINVTTTSVQLSSILGLNLGLRKCTFTDKQSWNVKMGHFLVTFEAVRDLWGIIRLFSGLWVLGWSRIAAVNPLHPTD